MLKVNEAWIREAEQTYPGFQKTLDFYESLDLPPCPKCGATDSARVSAGVIRRSIHLAAATTKIDNEDQADS